LRQRRKRLRLYAQTKTGQEGSVPPGPACSSDRKGFVVLLGCCVVERTFARLTQCRRLCREHEVLPANSEAMMYLAMTRLMMRRLAA